VVAGSQETELSLTAHRAVTDDGAVTDDDDRAVTDDDDRAVTDDDRHSTAIIMSQ
jgi:hypothetical protein